MRARLAELDMTQKDLCDRIGCHRSHLLRILDGTRSGEKYRLAIYRELGLPCTDELIKGA